MSVIPTAQNPFKRLPGAMAGLRPSRIGWDWWLVGSTSLILAIGSLLVWSATATNESLNHGQHNLYLYKHLFNVAIGLTLAAGVMLIDHRWVRILTPALYLLSLLGLALVLVAGSTINGSRSWLLIGGMSIQPAEFAKLAVICAMAIIVAERVENDGHRQVNSLDVILMLVIAGLPAGLILLQPDLGTVLVLSATVFATLAVAGTPRKWLLGLLVTGLLAVVVVVQTGLLKQYQINRFLAFTNPSLDPRGAGYNTSQARIAIGNGGLWGQGLFEGSQTRAGFVPEQHTDFIFTVAGEELGLIGAGFLVLLFGILLWRALLISRRSGDIFGRVTAAGIACWLGFQTFQSVGMCLGIMPVTGVPLPMVSYGGSSLFASLLAVGLLLNIAQRQEIEPTYVPKL